MPENYLNADAEVFLGRLSEKGRMWAWMVIKEIRCQFPNADHWTTGGIDKGYIDIRFGVKDLANDRGRARLFLKYRGGSPCCYLHNELEEILKKHHGLPAEELEKRRAQVETTPKRSPTPDDFKEWLKGVAKYFEEADIWLEGNGYNPINYSGQMDKRVVMNDEPEIVPQVTASHAVLSPLNQILFGPPGTGKTYHTINKALEILDPDLLAKYKKEPDREVLKARFDELVKEGRIDFVTFHQSFSYEDFVEGIRAETREDGALEYRVKPGVFARLCEQAGRGVVDIEDPFELALLKLTEKAEQADSDWLHMQTNRGKHAEVRYSPERRTFLIRQEGRKNDGNPPTGNMKHVRTLYQTGKGGYNQTDERLMLDYLKTHCGLPADYEELASDRRKPFVLIIDEINRGNVSRIFGELITLIEPSKRAGASEALSTILPYSKRPFSVPDNLYLIGTMNTADRSLAGLDIALRRRFTFEEMPPRPELLEEVVIEDGETSVNLCELLTVINQRIEVLLDRDHCLGHAYFMPLKADSSLSKLGKLATIFKNQILPLLQEYFFEDWQRIAWVLNDHRKASKETMFLHAPELDVRALLGDVPVSAQGQRWVLNEKAFNHIESYILTIKGDKESS